MTETAKETTAPKPDAIKPWHSKLFGGLNAPKLKDRVLPVTVIAIHSTEGQERGGSASGACSWFDNPESKGNANYCVEADVTICFADSRKLTWHASGINPVSIGIEICGKAGQTAGEWLDEWSTKALKRAAELCAALCIEHNIEVRRLTDDEIRACKAGSTDVTGFAGHVDINRALGVKAGHWDPGPHFPWHEFLLAVRGHIELLGGYRDTKPETDEAKA